MPDRKKGGERRDEKTPDCTYHSSRCRRYCTHIQSNHLRTGETAGSASSGPGEEPAGRVGPCTGQTAASGKTDTLKAARRRHSRRGQRQLYHRPEDVLFIYVWKEENLSRTVPVRMDGMISIPSSTTSRRGDDASAAQGSPVGKLREFVETPDVTIIVTEANSYRSISRVR